MSGITRSNTATSLNLTPTLTTGTINTTASSQTTSTGIAANGSAAIQQVNILNGEVTATALKSESTTSHDSLLNIFGVSAAGTTFTNLVVGGTPISGTPAPNTVITLPGIGTVTLNQQTSYNQATSASLTVQAIVVNVTISNPKAPVGTQVIVGSATSRLSGPVLGILRGLSYGTFARVGSVVTAGESFPEPMPCLGTNGTTRNNSGAATSIKSTLVTGTVADTAEGVDSATTVSGEMTSSVQNLNLLNGLVTASVVKADVTATGNPPTLGDTSSFVGLHVSGNPQITDNVAPNTEVTLPGVGVLWLHKQIKSSTDIQVIMMQLYVTVSGNKYGLAFHTTVNVAAASVGVI